MRSRECAYEHEKRIEMSYEVGFDRTIEINLGYTSMQFELPQSPDMTEDEFYEYAVDYVYSNISIDVL